MVEALTKNRILALLGALAVAILAYAWIDGGREPVHAIVQPVPLPPVPLSGVTQ